MQNIVLDSSVIVKWVNRQDELNIKESDKLLDDCRQGLIKLFTSELAKYEIGNVLWKKKLNPDLFYPVFDAVYSGPIEFISLNFQNAVRILKIANESKMTYYDATFVELAESLKATLVTDNPKHQNKYKDIKIISLGDYK